MRKECNGVNEVRMRENLFGVIYINITVQRS